MDYSYSRSHRMARRGKGGSHRRLPPQWRRPRGFTRPPRDNPPQQQPLYNTVEKKYLALEFIMKKQGEEEDPISFYDRKLSILEILNDTLGEVPLPEHALIDYIWPLFSPEVQDFLTEQYLTDRESIRRHLYSYSMDVRTKLYSPCLQDICTESPDTALSDVFPQEEQSTVEVAHISVTRPEFIPRWYSEWPFKIFPVIDQHEDEILIPGLFEMVIDQQSPHRNEDEINVKENVSPEFQGPGTESYAEGIEISSKEILSPKLEEINKEMVAATDVANGMIEINTNFEREVDQIEESVHYETEAVQMGKSTSICQETESFKSEENTDEAEAREEFNILPVLLKHSPANKTNFETVLQSLTRPERKITRAESAGDKNKLMLEMAIANEAKTAPSINSTTKSLPLMKLKSTVPPTQLKTSAPGRNLHGVRHRATVPKAALRRKQQQGSAVLNKNMSNFFETQPTSLNFHTEAKQPREKLELNFGSSAYSHKRNQLPVDILLHHSPGPPGEQAIPAWKPYRLHLMKGLGFHPGRPPSRA